jgi:hypothetical protein
LGSFFAGIKAGTLSGVLYLGGMAAFNVVLLYALKPEVISLIQRSYPSTCAPLGGVNGIGVEDCFASVVAVDVPYIAFVGFFVALLYSGIFGRFYDSLPGGGATFKGETIAALVGANLVFFGFSGFFFDFNASAATAAFLVLWTPVFGYYLGKLYKKYTRVVEFQSRDADSLRILVDGRDFTGKSKTLALTSNHKVRAETSDDASFREWETAGGITVDDSRSFETTIEINGDGVLKALVTKKY